MDFRVRRAARVDLDPVVAFMAALHAEAGPTFDGRAFDAARARAALERLLDDEALGRAWVIEADGGPVGYAVLTLGYSLEFHGRDAFIDELFVATGARGWGIGTAVVERLAEEARALGARALHLEVERANTDAQRLYRRLGFRDHDRYLLTRRLEP